MSGGHFGYDQYKIQSIVDSIEKIIQDNEIVDNEYGWTGYQFSEDTLAKIKRGKIF